MLVRDAMTPNPITVAPSTPLPEIDAIMHQHRIRRVPVMDGDRLVGIISDHDVMANLPSPATLLSRWELNTLLEKVEARDIMSHPVYVVSPDCPLEEVARFLLEKKFGALPVVENTRLVGIVTESDIFRMFVEMLSGGDLPGLRFELRCERHVGVVASIAQMVNAHGGRIITIATLNEPDGVHKRVLIKEEGADPTALRAALEAGEVEILDVRQRRQCHIWTVG
jgi:acetoin utilization protein AcuB